MHRERRRGREIEPSPPPGGVRPRDVLPRVVRPCYVLAGMALSLLLAAMSVPSLQTFWAQVGLMLPDRDTTGQRAAWRAYGRAVRREPEFMEAEDALHDALEDRPDTSPPKADLLNGLYAYLSLLPALPSARGPVATCPAEEDASLAARIRELKNAPPARLHAAGHRAAACAAFQSAGMSPRRAAHDADLVDMQYASQYRPVLRRLAGGLLAQGRAWQQTGRPGDAVAAYSAAARLMLDLVDESPRPPMVLLAAEYLSTALRDLAEVAGPAGLPPEIAEHGRATAAQLEAIGRRWQDDANRGLNLLPNTGDVTLARREHDRALGSMLASGYAIGAWLTLAAVCLVLLSSVVGFWTSGAVIRWRWGGVGTAAAAGIITLPLLAAVVAALGADLPLVWLFSWPRLWHGPGDDAWPFVLPVAALLAPLVSLTPVLVGLTAWVWAKLPDEQACIRMPRTVVIALAAAALVVLAVRAAFPVHVESWQPPAGVQLFRRLAPWAAIESPVLVLVWMIWGLIRRRRFKLKGGARAAACFGVAAWAWLATSAIGFGLLQMNARNNARHEAEFTAATTDPLADRLGPGWREEHFQGLRDLLNGIQRQ